MAAPGQVHGAQAPAAGAAEKGGRRALSQLLWNLGSKGPAHCAQGAICLGIGSWGPSLLWCSPRALPHGPSAQ